MPSIMRIALALLLTLTSFVSAQEDPLPLVCQSGVQIIAVVGTNVSNGTNSYGLTVTFVRDVMAAIPNSGNWSMNYNRFPGSLTPQQSFQPEVLEGTAEFIATLQNYTAACPDTPLVIHGYSEGAVVVMNALCGASEGNFPATEPLDSSYADQIISVILYGDESRAANQSYNLPTDSSGCTVGGPHLARKNPAGCDAFAPVMRSYCLADDTDCCATANATAVYTYPPHWLYPEYDTDATNWVVSHYNSYTSSASTTVPTTTSTTSTSSSTTSSSTTTTTTTSSTLSKTTTGPTTTKAAKTHTTLPIASTCTVDKCISSFMVHPATASRFCPRLATGAAIGTPFPTACSPNYASRVVSACECLGLYTASTTEAPTSSTTTS